MRIPLIKKIQLWIVRHFINWLNFVLNIFNKMLFIELKSAPKNILIYKIGNIGDIVCAVPSFMAIRQYYPEAKITLLSSPGKRDVPGAKEFVKRCLVF